MGIDTLAFKDYNDTKDVLDFIDKYIDRDEIYKAELENKLNDFFGALKWEMASVESQNAKKFFEF